MMYPDLCADAAYYVFDMPAVRDRIGVLRDLLGPRVKLAYAVKANTFILQEMEPLVDRFEICSPGESRICDQLGIPREKTVISGVYKTPAFIEELVTHTDGRIYTVESLQQFELLRSLSELHRKELTVLLRLTNGSQFGINAPEIRDIVSRRDEFPFLKLQGIQYFSGTQKTSLKKLKRELDKLDALLQELEASYGYHAQELEFGPGFPVDYFGDGDFDERELIGGFAQMLEDMTFRCEITLELGRSIAACCGQYYTHIVDQKRNKGQNYLLVDGGMHHLVYFGQYMGMKLPKVTHFTDSTEPSGQWNICGSLCSMNDILVKDLPLRAPAIGQTLCFHNTGAYCMTEGIALFLTRELPGVFVVTLDGSVQCVRRPTETFPWNCPQTEND